MTKLALRLRNIVWRVFQLLGYNVASIAKQQAEAKRLSTDRWRWLETLGIGTLVDVGANTGQFAQQFLGVRPDSLIYSFEPLTDCFEELQRTIAGTPGFTAYNVALGESDGEAVFFRSGYSPSSSLLRMGEPHKGLFPYTRDIASQTVTLRRLDSYLDEITIRGGLLVKIDVQGAEAQVLKGGREVLSSADAVLAEVGYFPLYNGQSTIQEISGLLDEYGFTFMGMVDQYLRPSDSLPVYGDALFVSRAALERFAQVSASGSVMPAAGPSIGR